MSPTPRLAGCKIRIFRPHTQQKKPIFLAQQATAPHQDSRWRELELYLFCPLTGTKKSIILPTNSSCWRDMKLDFFAPVQGQKRPASFPPTPGVCGVPNSTFGALRLEYLKVFMQYSIWTYVQDKLMLCSAHQITYCIDDETQKLKNQMNRVTKKSQI